MAALRGLQRTVKIFSTSAQHRLLSTSKCLSGGGGWIKDWKPAPYPEDKKSREEAAKKYNLIPEDYKPIDNDGLGAGDYPDIPPVGMHERSDFEVYDFPHLKRNYGEPLHRDFDAYLGERVYPGHAEQVKKEMGISRNAQILLLFGIVGGVFILSNTGFDIFRPLMPMQYKYGYQTNKDTVYTHYTFEPADK